MFWPHVFDLISNVRRKFYSWLCQYLLQLVQLPRQTSHLLLQSLHPGVIVGAGEAAGALLAAGQGLVDGGVAGAVLGVDGVVGEAEEGSVGGVEHGW